MTSSNHVPLRSAAAAFSLVFLLSSCTPSETPDEDQNGEPQGTEQTQEEDTEGPIPAPEYEDDDSVRLPIALITPVDQRSGAPLDDAAGQALPGQSPPHQTEIARSDVFGCEDTVSVVRTVPIVTEDPVVAGLEFLLDSTPYQHGQPGFINPLSSSQLEVVSAEADGDTVTVELTGFPAVQNACQSWQMTMQIEATARMAAGTSSAEVLLDGVPLAEYLGLVVEEGPLALHEIEAELD